MRDICRWHVEEFAYLLGKLKAMPEGDGTLLDHTLRRVRARARRGESAQGQRPGADPRRPRRRHEDRHALEDAQHDRRSLPDGRRRSLQAAAREGLPDRGEEDQRDRLLPSATAACQLTERSCSVASARRRIRTARCRRSASAPSSRPAAGRATRWCRGNRRRRTCARC